MTNINPVNVGDLQGGLWSGEPTLAQGNQLTVAQNFFYNKDGILQTRRGSRSFGNPIPSSFQLLHNCDSVSGNGTWSAFGDAVSVSLGSAKQGVGSIAFNVDVSNSVANEASIENSTMATVDISSSKGKVGIFVFVPTGGKTELSEVNLDIGSDGSNYYRFLIPLISLTENSWNYVVINYADASLVGTPVDTAIDYLRFRLAYTSSYVDVSGFRIDEIYSYGNSSTKAMKSLKYFKATTPSEPRYLHANCGTALWEYDEASGNWFVIKSGLTEDTYFSSFAYKNVMYFSNGVDDYMSYSGVTVTAHTGSDVYKGKYLLLANDVAYNFGDPSVPSTLAYTDATPANAITFPNVVVLDQDDSSGRGTGVINLGPIVIASKQGKIYRVNIATPSAEQIDYSDGAVGHRCFTRVENAVWFLNERGVYNLAQRESVQGDLRATPITDNVQQIVDELTNREYAAAFYSQRLRNFYLFGDSNNDGANDVCLVASLVEDTKQGGLKRAFTQYTGINANEVVEYEDSDGEKHLLAANALGGQMIEIEYGTNDDDVEIEYIAQTKTHDFERPETYKTFEYVDLFGFVSEGSSFKVQVYVDDELASESDVTSDAYLSMGSSLQYYLAGSALAETPLGGSGAETNTSFYPFVIRVPVFQTGRTIYLKVYSNELDSQFMLTKYRIYPTAQQFEFFLSEFIA